MDYFIDSLGEKAVSSTIDANSGYCQIEIEPKNLEKTGVKAPMAFSSLKECQSGSATPPTPFKEPWMS